MGTLYRYSRDGREYGPVSSAQLKRLAASGELGGEDLVWKEGSTHRLSASAVRGLFDASAAGQDAPKFTASTTAVATATPPVKTPMQEAPASVPAAVPAAVAATASGSSKSDGPGFLARFLDEARATAGATGMQVRRMLIAGRHKRSEISLRAEARRAQQEFGERLYKAGIGETDLLAAITRANERIVELAAAKSSTRAVADERAELHRRLAEPFIDGVPHPGMEQDHRVALAARQTLNDHVARGVGITGGLWPSNPTERRRVGTGFGTAGVAILLAGYLAFGPGGAPPGPALPPGSGDESAVAIDPQTSGTGVDGGSASDASSSNTGERQAGAIENALAAVNPSQASEMRQESQADAEPAAQPAPTQYQATCRNCGFTTVAPSYEAARMMASQHQQSARRLSAMQRGASASPHVTVVLPLR
jgi:hypothetical protein